MPIPQKAFLWNGHLARHQTLFRNGLIFSFFVIPKESLHDDTNSTKNTNL